MFVPKAVDYLFVSYRLFLSTATCMNWHYMHLVFFILSHLYPSSRKLIVNALLSDDRVGMAVILDAASGARYADPKVL